MGSTTGKPMPTEVHVKSRTMDQNDRGRSVMGYIENIPLHRSKTEPGPMDNQTMDLKVDMAESAVHGGSRWIKMIQVE